MIIVDDYETKLFIFAYCKFLKIKIKREDIVYIGDKIDNIIEYIMKDTNSKFKFLLNSKNLNKDTISNNIKQQIGEILFKKCEIFIFPNDIENGNIDLLIEKIAGDKNLWDICKEFITKLNTELKKEHSILRTYLIYYDSKAKTEIKLIEEHFNLESEHLIPLKEFLLK